MNATALLERKPDMVTEGAEFVTRGRTITEGDITSFSALTGDWHPQHSDAEWAARSRFEGRVAHGMLILSYAIGLLPFDPERVVALRGFESATFKRPVAIGDTISVRCSVDASRPLDDESALVTLALRVVNQDGRAVAVARIQAVCKQEASEQATNKAVRRSADGMGSKAASLPANHRRTWREDVESVYGAEAFL
jgi:3-hydroxybutyryl-CoA dehydratase